MFTAPELPAPAFSTAQNDIKLVYKKIEEGADVNFVYGRAYKCPQGYTPLMVACHRGRCAVAVWYAQQPQCSQSAVMHHEGLRLCVPILPYRACRLECAKALLRAGADPNFMNGAGDLTLFWGIDGGERSWDLLLVQQAVQCGGGVKLPRPVPWLPASSMCAPSQPVPAWPVSTTGRSLLRRR